VEQALHDAIAVTARAAFMQRLVEGHGFAKRRVEHGYVNLYPAFRDKAAGEKMNVEGHCHCGAISPARSFVPTS
jgi:hypothetical protein